jgi:hypothetical protein
MCCSNNITSELKWLTRAGDNYHGSLKSSWDNLETFSHLSAKHSRGRLISYQSNFCLIICSFIGFCPLPFLLFHLYQHFCDPSQINYLHSQSFLRFVSEETQTRTIIITHICYIFIYAKKDLWNNVRGFNMHKNSN